MQPFKLTLNRKIKSNTNFLSRSRPKLISSSYQEKWVKMRWWWRLTKKKLVYRKVKHHTKMLRVLGQNPRKVAGSSHSAYKTTTNLSFWYLNPTTMRLRSLRITLSSKSSFHQIALKLELTPLAWPEEIQSWMNEDWPLKGGPQLSFQARRVQ